MKLSSTPEKATYPCLKKIYRIVDENRQYFDIIALESEEFSIGDMIEIGSLKTSKLNNVKISSVRLLNDVLSLDHVSINESR